jgi:hypothetical protein
MVLDDLMPRYDVVERHRTLVRAAPADVYAAIRVADLSGGVLTRALLALRAIPAVLIAFTRAPRATVIALRTRPRRGTSLADFERAGFHVVAERAPEELVIGLLGRFWTPRGDLCAGVTEDTFRTAPPAGMALAAWNFTVIAREHGHSELRTETRVWCAPDARRRFRMYWLIVRPGSGLIRRSMLRAIRRTAERRGASGSGSHGARAE